MVITGYSYPPIRLLLTRRGIRSVIPRRSDQRRLDRRHRFDPMVYRERNRIERMLRRLKQFCGIATHYEKCVNPYLPC